MCARPSGFLPFRSARIVPTIPPRRRNHGGEAEAVDGLTSSAATSTQASAHVPTLRGYANRHARHVHDVVPEAKDCPMASNNLLTLCERCDPAFVERGASSYVTRA